MGHDGHEVVTAASVAEARDRLAETRILAPAAGTILERSVNPGQVITAGTYQVKGKVPKDLHPVEAALLLATALPLSAQTGLTVYNSGRVLVRRTLPVAVPKGASDQRLNLGLLDPASIFPLDPAVSILTATYDGGTDQQSTLRRAVGREEVTARERSSPMKRIILAASAAILAAISGGSTRRPSSST